MTYACPYCSFVFKAFAANSAAVSLPDVAPILCEDCLKISLWENGAIRAVSDVELTSIKKSPAYKDVLQPLIGMIQTEKRRRKASSN